MRTSLAVGLILLGLIGCTDDTSVIVPAKDAGAAGGTGGAAGSSGTGGTQETDGGGTGGASGTGGSGGASGTGGSGGASGTGGTGGTTASACGNAARYAGVASAIEQQLTDQNLIGISAAVIEGGQLCWSQGFGSKRSVVFDPVASTTLFETNSFTLTTIGLLQQVEQGTLDLDEPLVTYLPELTVDGSTSWTERATARHLLQLSDGLTFDFPPAAYVQSSANDTGLEEAFLNASNQAHLHEEFPPGGLMRGSVVGEEMRGWLLERQSGQLYSQYLQQHILSQLGITRGYFTYADVLADGDYAQPAHEYSLKRPFAGLFTSVDEEAKLAQFLLHGNTQVLSSASYDVLLAKVWDISPLFGSPYWVGNGSTMFNGGILFPDGYAPTGVEQVSLHLAWNHSEWIYLVPSRDFALVLLSNSSGMDGAAVLRTAYEDLLGIDVPAQSFAPGDPSDYSTFVGDYDGPALSAPIHVTLESGQLSLRVGDSGFSCSLVPQYPRAFGCQGFSWGNFVSFWPDGNGDSEYLFTGHMVATRVPDIDAGTGDASPE